VGRNERPEPAVVGWVPPGSANDAPWHQVAPVAPDACAPRGTDDEMAGQRRAGRRLAARYAPGEHLGLPAA